MQETWKEKVKDAIENGIIYPDGHQIVDPKFYEGFDVDHLVFVYESDFNSGSSKTVIFDAEGEPMKECKGVYNLDFLDWVANKSGVKYRGAYGRGTEARNIVDALTHWSGADPDVLG